MVFESHFWHCIEEVPLPEDYAAALRYSQSEWAAELSTRAYNEMMREDELERLAATRSTAIVPPAVPRKICESDDYIDWDEKSEPGEEFILGISPPGTEHPGLVGEPAGGL
jgi:hypothetical protein